MKTIKMLGRGLFPVAAVLAAACSSSSSSSSDAGPLDGGPADGAAKHDAADAGPAKDGATGDAKGDVAVTDGGTSDAASDAAPDAAAQRHVLVTYDGTSATGSTTLALNLVTGNVDGTLTTADPQVITDTSNVLAPFVLAQTTDVVERLDPTTWTVAGSWSTAIPGDAGGKYSNPYQVSVATETQVYAVRYDSNVIDVFDMSTPTDAGVAKASIDLTSLVQAADTDGNVEATAAVYVASSKRLYVLLENIDTLQTLDYMGSFDTLCVNTVASIVAIDTTSNQLLGLGGTAPGGGIQLLGYDPTSLTYDATNGRLLVFNAGCNPAPTADGGAPGALQQRGIEAVDLTANTTKILVDTSDKGFPGSFAYIDGTHAVVGFSYPAYEAYSWDPTTNALGALLPNAPQVFASDGNGNLVGATVNYGIDGGANTTDIVSMSLASGTATTLKADAVTLGNGYLGSVGVWPRP
jgi:hypothetical protein